MASPSLAPSKPLSTAEQTTLDVNRRLRYQRGGGFAVSRSVHVLGFYLVLRECQERGITLKTLYIVSVAFEFPVMAEDEEEAVSYIEVASEDVMKASASRFELNKKLPDYSPDGQVYGTSGVTFAEAVEKEKRLAEMGSKQIKLPW
jgi:hypothetical protein